MNPTDADQLPRDPDISRLYQAYPAGEPPAALDAAILAAARQALAPRPRPWWQRLQVPVAIAATGMLAVMLTLTMQRNPEEASFPPASAPESSAPAQPAAPPLGTRAPAVENKAASPQRQAPAAAKAERSDRVLEAELPPPPPPAAAVAPAPEPAAAVAGSYAAPPAKPASPPMESRATAPSPALADSLRNEQARSTEAVGKIAPAPPAAAAPAPQRLRAVMRTPEDWLTQIRNLREQGQLEAAAREWEAFRKAYPDYPLPEDLRHRP